MAAKLSRTGVKRAAVAAWQRLRGGRLEPGRAAASVAIGGFIGCLPVYGLQTPLCALLTLPMRLDFALAWTVMLFANPLTALPLVLVEIELGAWLCTGESVALPTLHTSLHDLLPYAKFVAAGSVALGALTALVGGAVAYALARMMLRRGPQLHSITRTESIQ